MAVGSWQLAVGSWQLAVGSWQLAVGSWQLAVVFLYQFKSPSYPRRIRLHAVCLVPTDIIIAPTTIYM
ncbi:hypothetical protein [Microcoleus sp. PH2017_09_SFU_O_A]|uniref:hypothetical protein n=1 Tax=Microcoleus sp. PH2017_09_SFU_O_A TaxID=2798820 RepID=UPI001D3591FC|nr:hypothetical protein [Microcoleus sp. PH2017_09_SFU_O_A]MCC3449290.1 hypothetical protein [Microcoleus sp. PH2017_09_SFU_O_A]